MLFVQHFGFIWNKSDQYITSIGFPYLSAHWMTEQCPGLCLSNKPLRHANWVVLSIVSEVDTGLTASSMTALAQNISVSTAVLARQLSSSRNHQTLYLSLLRVNGDVLDNSHFSRFYSPSIVGTRLKPLKGLSTVFHEVSHLQLQQHGL